MSALQELIKQVSDPKLRAMLHEEASKLLEQRKFGLVFENHLPECTPLYNIPVQVGATVAKKVGYIQDIYRVISINKGTATCIHEKTGEECAFPIDDLVTIAEFGTEIYPCLQKLDTVENAPDSDLWHTLIEADNYHALQLLTYLYAGKVDCIYIDPPYNTGAKDWKYNNDYVDGSDSYRHSKWLSMMKKRLLLAKKLLNPNDSVLIITIDEKEYLHLGCLLEDIFPEAYIQMISSIINPKGVSSLQGFKKADEYIYYVMFGKSSPAALPLENEWSPSSIKSNSDFQKLKKDKQEPGWTSMMRRGSHSSRIERPGLYYAIYADPNSHKIVKIGDVLPLEKNKDVEHEGLIQILPIRTNGSLGCWQVGPSELKNRIKQGRVRLGKKTAYGFVVNYLPDGEYRKIIEGIYKVENTATDGSLIAFRIDDTNDKWVAPTQWKIASHDASAYGSALLGTILVEKKFSFPKSLYAVHDTIRFFVANKPNALILDFFAGSGTTLHAVNLLNAEDGGNRRCILVTNNEVSADEAKTLTNKGYRPGDDEWDKLGIARYVTWPRTVCSIEGHDINKNPLKGSYIGSDLSMADGFHTNAIFFKLGFLNRAEVTLGMQFKALLSTLWMKAGAIGSCPELSSDDTPDMLILPNNHFAVLINEAAYSLFLKKMKGHKEIKTLFIVTDSEINYRKMIRGFENRDTYQLYRDYLRNFTINVRRD